MTIIQQHDHSDCGAACLAGVASYYGKLLSVAHVRMLAGTNARGTTLGDLQRAALKLGFQAEATRGDYTGLAQAPLPAIVHVDHIDTGDHFVVITRTGKRTITLLNPADGRRHRWPIARFKQYWSGASLLLLPGPTFFVDSDGPASSVWRRIYQLFLPYQRYLTRAFLLAVLTTALITSGALFVALLTDYIVPREQTSALHSLGVLFLLILLLQVIVSAIRKSITLHTTRLIDSRLLRTYTTHLLQLPQSVFNSLKPGELLSRMGDALFIRRLVNDLLIQAGVPALSLVVVLLVALARSPALAVWLLLSMIAYAMIYMLATAFHRTVQHRLLVSDAALDDRFTETFGAIGTVKQLGAERFHGIRLETHIHDFVTAAHTARRVSIWTDEATSFLAQGFSLALLWGGSTFVLSGAVSLGELLAFYTLSGYFTAAAAQLMPLAQYVQEARIAAERLFSLLDLPVADLPGTTRFEPDDILPVVVENVHFAYREGTNVLCQLSLTLLPGTVTLIRGASGSGKSTLTSLLLRQYSPTSGSIYLGIHPLELVDREALHGHIAIVPQHIQLFDDTLVANICLGETPDLARLETLCDELGLLPIIHTWPRGFDTSLGPDGCLLSGGQRQLVALARALYRQPRLLLLDEATSALDRATETRVFRLLKRLKTTGMAVLWISHNDNGTRLADSVYQLKEGQLVLYRFYSHFIGTVAITKPDADVAIPTKWIK